MSYGATDVNFNRAQASFRIAGDEVLRNEIDWNWKAIRVNIPGYNPNTNTPIDAVTRGWVKNWEIEVVEGNLRLPDGVKMGDVNGDGVVNAADALLALRLATGQTPAEAVNPDAARISGGATVTVSDALAILLMAIGAA